MSRLFVFALLVGLVMNTSCERCMKCTYSYTETVIITTPDGEEELKTEKENLVLLDEDGEAYSSECLKREEYKGKDSPFTIKTYYELEASKTELDNYQYECVEQ